MVRFLIGDATAPARSSPRWRSARENARTVRDIVPREAWEQLNELYLNAKEQPASGLSQRGRYDYPRTSSSARQQITGLLAGTMSHDHGYQFLRLGRNLERADMTTRIVDVRSASLLPEQDDAADPVREHPVDERAEVADRLPDVPPRDAGAGSAVRDVLRFLFRSRGSRARSTTALGRSPAAWRDLPRNDAPLKSVQHLERSILSSQPDKLNSKELHDFIDEIQLELDKLHEVITRTYFAVNAPVAATA